MERLCSEIEKQTNAQFAILTIPSLEGRSSEEFALETFNRWGIGHKEDNRGIMILLVKDDHAYRIEIGRGLESVLPDEKVAAIGREMIPLLRHGKYGDGVTHAMKRLRESIPPKAK